MYPLTGEENFLVLVLKVCILNQILSSTFSYEEDYITFLHS